MGYAGSLENLGVFTSQSLMDPQTRLHGELLGLLRQHSRFCDLRNLVLLAHMAAGLLLSESICFDCWNPQMPQKKPSLPAS